MDVPLVEERGVSTSSSSSDGESDAENHVQGSEGRSSQQGDSSGDDSEIHVHEQTVTPPEKEVLVETEAKAGDEEGKVSPQASAEGEPSSFIAYKRESPSEITELEEHVTNDITEISKENCLKSEKENQGRNIDSESLGPYIDEGSKPSSSSKTRVAGPALAEVDEQDQGDMEEDEYVKKSFTCDSNVEEEEDEQLREYWTRALQTGTSTGEVVEEIVKVLKHHQKSHDLLCPVCGSCVTRRVILRKRKRSNFISIDRWYRDPLDEEGDEVPEERGPPDDAKEIEEEGDRREYYDTEAFGCLACFSLFFDKGRRLWSKIQDVGPDTFNCLPFFFPPYPWGMTQRRSASPGLQEAPILQETEEIDTQHALTTDVRPDYTCGLGSKLLPDYPWGTTALLSKEEETRELTDAGTQSQAIGLMQDEGKSPPSKEMTCNLEIVPAIFPDYPWGRMPRVEDYAGLPQAEDIVDEEVWHQEVVEGLSQAQREEPSYTCELAPALLPDYPWGSMSRKDHSSVTQAEHIVGVSQGEVEETSADLQRKGRSCSCGLVPALLPNYPWGYFAKEEVAAASHVETKIEPEAEVVEVYEPTLAVDVNEPTLEDKGPSCDVVSAVLPNYPWGITTQVEESIDEAPVLSNRRKRKKALFRNGFHLPALEGAGSTILPPYPWGTWSLRNSVHEQNGGPQTGTGTGTAERDCTCGLGSAMLPTFPWGQTHSAGNIRQEQAGGKMSQSYIEQETKIEARIRSKTNVYTVTASKVTYPGGKPPPKEIKAVTPDQISQTVGSVRLDQTVTVLEASVTVDQEVSSGMKGRTPPLHSLPSTGYALLEPGDHHSPKNERLETKPSTGYTYLEELTKEGHDESSKLKITEIEEDPVSVKYTPQTKPANTLHSIAEETFYKDPNRKPHVQFPTFQWAVGKVDAGDLTTPLLKASVEHEGDTFISVLKPSSGPVEESKSDNWLSVLKVSRPPDDEGITAPSLSIVSGYKEEIQEEVDTVAHQRPQVEAVIPMPPSSAGPAVGATATASEAMAAKKKKEEDGWDILKSIVYGGLDISIASLGVTSAAAGGNAITRTVVYMGIATLASGLIGFYHNVLNLYHYHRDHYTDMVGLSLFLHGTVALISYLVFGALSPLIYAFSYRKTDNRDDKFILCCGVTVVTVTALGLGKAKVSNKRYLRTPFAYLMGGVSAAIVGYLTGEHVSELLEQWGL